MYLEYSGNGKLIILRTNVYWMNRLEDKWSYSCKNDQVWSSTITKGQVTRSSDVITNDNNHPIDHDKNQLFFSILPSDILSISRALIITNRNVMFSPSVLRIEYIPL